MSGSEFLASRPQISVQEITDAFDALAPEFEVEARKCEVERRPTAAPGAPHVGRRVEAIKPAAPGKPRLRRLWRECRG